MRTFITLYASSIRDAENFLSQKARINAVVTSVTQAVHRFGCLTYLGRHRTLFCLVAALKVLQHERGGVSAEHKHCLYKPAAHLQLSSCPKKPKDWLSDQAYLNLLALAERVPRFSNILELVSKKEVWRTWMDKEKIEEEPCPDADLDVLHRCALSTHVDMALRCVGVIITLTYEEHLPFPVARSPDDCLPQHLYD